MTSNITTLAQIDTKFNADSIEWCPEYPAYFVCGTYQLVEGKPGENELKSSKNNSRIGSIILLKFDVASKSLSEIQSISTAAITDMKWYHYDGTPLLGITSSSGELGLYSLVKSENECNLQKIKSFDVCAPNLSLSLDWAGIESRITVSDSDGGISVMRIAENGCEIELEQKWKAHNFDAWITAYDRWNTHVVYSGGDDCLLKGWDTRSPCYKPIFMNKNHTMGVCAIQSSSLVENVFASGSYDEQIHVWDSRSLKKPLTSCDVSGGIWRLKWHTTNPDYLLAACCRSGFHVLNVDLKTRDTAKVVASYTAHKSLAYGADWCRCPRNNGNYHPLHEVIATCSFYDHRLDVWELINTV